MRQYKIIALVIQVILLAQTNYCGFERTAQPAAVIGRGLSGSALLQFENLWINPVSVIAAASFRSSIFYTPSQFQLPQLSNYGLISGTSFGAMSVAVGLQSFGFSLYRETDGFLALGSMIGEDAGVGFNFHLYHLSIMNYGSSVSGVIDLGVLYRITDAVSVAAVIHNLSGADFGTDDDIPRTMVAGISLTVAPLAVVNADVVKEMRYSPTIRVGTDVQLHDHFTVRAGVTSGTSRLFGGFSVSILPLRMDYGFSSHADLGPTHSIGISIE